MIFIAHRGNLNGPSPLENRPDYLRRALDQGFDVEADVWWDGRHGFYLGHDEPQYAADVGFLINPSIWCHAKNLKALHELLKIGAHCFFHDNDDATLTSRGYVWTYPGRELGEQSICVLPKIEIEEVNYGDLTKYAGICTDYIASFHSPKKPI